jgi:ornithine cyclodeaminase/alanine dehydrogenase-like protein (mu-crystallin family)
MAIENKMDCIMKQNRNMVKLISFNGIERLNISSIQYIEWVKEAFLLKSTSHLPAKISMKMPDNIFFNSMPCVIPTIGRFGIKTVTRYPKRIPSLVSEILLFDYNTGNLLSFMDGDIITAMRTGAIAALATCTLKKSNAKTYSFIGLGNTARATLLCLLEILDEPISVRLFAYKNQAEQFIERFKYHKNVNFEIIDTYKQLIKYTDVIISCVSAADMIFGKDSWYQEGITVIPVHTRGFQNCDLFFDKVFTDDKAHIHDFKNFDKFKSLNELSEIFANKCTGRDNDAQKIIAYNIGISLHDIYIASQIYDMFDDTLFVDLYKPKEKFWI